MKRLLVIAIVIGLVVSAGVLAALVTRPPAARSVPAIELATPSTAGAPATTTSTREEASDGRSRDGSGPATSAPGGANPAPAAPPAPAGGGDDDGGGGEGDDGGDDDSGGDDDGGGDD
jgi:hypothetical protein